MAWTLTTSSEELGEIAWFPSLTSGTIDEFGEQLIEVVTSTTGLSARKTPYTARFDLHSEDVCVCREQTIEIAIELVVTAETSAAKSYVEIVRPGSIMAGDTLVFLSRRSMTKA